MKKMLIFVGTANNNNKFYQLELEGNTVNVEYGRVGSSPQRTSYPGGEKVFQKKLKEKLRKGYVESKVDTEIIESDTGSKGNILEIAMEQIITDDISAKLIAKLVQQNIHNITSNTKIKYDIKTGYFKTALGIITKRGVEEAIDLLAEISHMVINDFHSHKYKKQFIILNENYFMMIPTRLANLRDFNNLLITEKRVNEQIDICEALLNSLEIIEAEKAKLKQGSDTKIVHEKLFEASVLELNDNQEFKRLEKYFIDSKNKRHGHQAYKIDKIYKVSLGKEKEEYRTDLNNHMELFHGTKVANLLSILKSGLLMPKYSPGQSTGYMFGQGLYFANQSTKSLNYCDGMYWNRTQSQNKIYMFVADIAMGNYQVPNSSKSRKPDLGYDSYWAKPGKSGIQNDEMIVFNNNQIKLKYILEISK